MGFWNKFKRRSRTQHRDEAVAITTIEEVKTAEEDNEAVLEDENGKVYTLNEKGVWINNIALTDVNSTDSKVLLEYTHTSNWSQVDLTWPEDKDYNVIKVFINGQSAGGLRLYCRLFLNEVLRTSQYSYSTFGMFANDGMPRYRTTSAGYFYITYSSTSSYALHTGEGNTVGGELTLYNNNNNQSPTWSSKTAYKARVGGGFVEGAGSALNATGDLTGIRFNSNEGSMKNTQFTVIGYRK